MSCMYKTYDKLHSEWKVCIYKIEIKNYCRAYY